MSYKKVSLDDVRNGIAVGDETVMQRWLDNFANINADQNIPESKGWTALHYAVFYKNTDAVRILLRNNPDTEKKSRSGKKALDLLDDSNKETKSLFDEFFKDKKEKLESKRKGKEITADVSLLEKSFQQKSIDPVMITDEKKTEKKPFKVVGTKKIDDNLIAEQVLAEADRIEAKITEERRKSVNEQLAGLISDASPSSGNLFNDAIFDPSKEKFQILFSTPGISIERIVSSGQKTPEGEWYDQSWIEWIILLKGSATVHFKDELERYLKIGDWITIKPHVRHRVDNTDPSQTTIWLAINIGKENCER